MKIGILGAGAYAMAMASVFYNNKCKIGIWSNSEDEVNELLRNRQSNKIDYDIPEDFVITTNMKLVIDNAGIIVIAVPSKFVRNVSLQLSKYYKDDQIICIASKGIEDDTCLFMSDVIREAINTDNIAIISGGTFAEDMVKNVPVGLTLATKSDKSRNVLLNILQNDYVKIETTTDIIGTQICGSIKNVFAIATGILDGMGYPVSTRSLFLKKVIYETRILIKDLGGEDDTILSFAGIGDIFLTCTSTKSRNYTLGKMIGEGKDKMEITSYIRSTTIEGLYTLETIKKIITDNGIDSPLIFLIDDIINERKNPSTLSRFLVEEK